MIYLLEIKALMKKRQTATSFTTEERLDSSVCILVAKLTPAKSRIIGKIRAKSKIQPSKSRNFEGWNVYFEGQNLVNKQCVVGCFHSDWPVVQFVTIEENLY